MVVTSAETLLSFVDWKSTRLYVFSISPALSALMVQNAQNATDLDLVSLQEAFLIFLIFLRELKYYRNRPRLFFLGLYFPIFVANSSSSEAVLLQVYLFYSNLVAAMQHFY